MYGAAPSNLRPLALQEAVQRPFEARQAVGRHRLMTLLQGSMICASKAKLEAAGLLPSCKKQVCQQCEGNFLRFF